MTYPYDNFGRIIPDQGEQERLLRLAEQRRREILEQEQAAHRARQEEVRRAKVAAEARAKTLLLTHLNDEQRKTFEESAYFDVVSNNGRTWRIRTNMGQSGNVFYMEDETKVASYCCYVRDYELPLFDHYLAQKIVLETNENYWLELAVVMEKYGWGPGRPLPTPIYDTEEKRQDHSRRRLAGLIRRF